MRTATAFVNHAEYMRAAMDAVEDHGITDRELRATLLGYHTQLFSQGDIDDSGNLCERELWGRGRGLRGRRPCRGR